MSLSFEYAGSYSDLEQFAALESPEPPLTHPYPDDALILEVDAAYDVLFAALIPFGASESGGSLRGKLVMSRYVEPAHQIVVVVRDGTADLRSAISAAHAALQMPAGSFSVRFDDYPTCVCVSRGGRVLGFDADQRYERLLPYGFPI